MSNYVERLENDKVVKWYGEYASIENINQRASELESRGYVLNAKSGLFLRELFENSVIKRIGRTIIDVAFLRPTDLHFHEDVDEFARVIGGNGYCLSLDQLGGKSFYSIGLTKRSRDIEILRGVKHSFSPHQEGFLELRIVCNGVLDPSKEQCVTPFYDLDAWKDLHGGMHTK